ncbi:hypothetical protein [Chryseobacterium sp. Leaf394]|uniref:hypothetical protein n=1 Tax=Chryseobacterium sp. Leaf394 TaxID=1736361 RepID=UPI0006F23A29|nr:hypothetical protein [Chryseobacterium sp. Leaf394]KQS88525.1 hypothetical protein ASG21_17045 [Chryseobacterium sp. Leaf394]
MGIFKNFFGGQTKHGSQDNKQDGELDGSRGNVILNFQHLIQESIEWNELKEVEFAMWLPCDQDNNFASSPMVDKWSTAYSLTKNYWSYIVADLLKTQKLVDEKTFRLGLPDNFQAFAFLTTDGEQIILSLSKEKGIRLHFSETTSLKYRLSFMNSFIMYCKAWKELADINKGKQDDDLGFENWWSFTVETSIALEENEPLIGVGIIAK